MASQKEMKAIREQALELFQSMEFEGFEVVGQAVEGVVMKYVELDAFVVFKPIVKKESFDVEDALQEFEDKARAAAEREAERLAKAAERAAKAAEKAKEKAAEVE